MFVILFFFLCRSNQANRKKFNITSNDKKQAQSDLLKSQKQNSFSSGSKNEKKHSIGKENTTSERTSLSSNTLDKIGNKRPECLSNSTKKTTIETKTGEQSDRSTSSTRLSVMQMIRAGATRKQLIMLDYSDEELEKVGYYRKNVFECNYVTDNSTNNICGRQKSNKLATGGNPATFPGNLDKFDHGQEKAHKSLKSKGKQLLDISKHDTPPLRTKTNPNCNST